METTSYIALSRQGALRREMDTVAHNIANMNTSAFKGEKMMFVEHLVKSRDDQSVLPKKLSFTRDVAQYRDLSEGPIKTTGNTLDVAIRGDGYFVVETPDGTPNYTRNGGFTMDSQGQLVTQSGNPVLSRGGAPIFLSPTDHNITISADGTLSTNNGQLGQLRVVRFDDPQKMQAEQAGLFSTDQAPQDVVRPSVLQGALEGSNIQPVIELSRMIEVHRAYDSVKTFIDSEDGRQKKMIDQLGARA
jgi:flagellar basal-body rod protein FlgF